MSPRGGQHTECSIFSRKVAASCEIKSVLRVELKAVDTIGNYSK